MEATNVKTNLSSSVNSMNQRKVPESHVRKLMLDAWYNSIFSLIKHRLQSGVMKIVYSERIGEPFDSQLVIGIRESFGRKKTLQKFDKIMKLFF